jgi:hypothetical protein
LRDDTKTSERLDRGQEEQETSRGGTEEKLGRSSA